MRTELTTGSPAPTFEATTDSGNTVNLKGRHAWLLHAVLWIPRYPF